MLKKTRLSAVAGLVAAAAFLAACSSGESPTEEAPAEETAAAAEEAPAEEAPAEEAAAAPAGDISICATFPILDQFLQKVADGMTAEAEAQGATINILAADEKTDVQVGQVENCIAQGASAILVVPVDTDATGPMTDAAVAAGVPLVYVNRRPADLPEGVPYVGSDSLVSGVLEMEELAKLAGGKGNVVILQGDPANEAAVLRTQGCKDIVAKNPDMTVIKEAAGNWQRDKGQAIMEDWIQSGDQIDVVCANNDEMALGAINALKAADLLDSVLVGGVDATADALAAMEAGELEVTVFQDASGQGGGGVAAAIQLINGETVESYVDIPYQLVTPANIADFQGKN